MPGLGDAMFLCPDEKHSRIDVRPDLLLHGVEAYAPNGVIGQPSLASAEKGRALLDALTSQFAARLEQLRAAPVGRSS